MGTQDRQFDLVGTLEHPSPGDGGNDSTGPTVDDDNTVTESVKAALLADNNLRGEHIGVEANGGRVVLSGSVRDQWQIEQATRIARSTSGVTAVDNRLSIATG